MLYAAKRDPYSPPRTAFVQDEQQKKKSFSVKAHLVFIIHSKNSIAQHPAWHRADVRSDSPDGTMGGCVYVLTFSEKELIKFNVSEACVLSALCVCIE